MFDEFEASPAIAAAHWFVEFEEYTNRIERGAAVTLRRK